ncbi:hypothetical protein [Arthrobacter sp. 2YAF22_2]|uniref:hypothetical protein n=1 Tax=Arthrobacter sp. 2YAF22_2 TaxID=3233029 RepID=UPI003F8EAB80
MTIAASPTAASAARREPAESTSPPRPQEEVTTMIRRLQNIRIFNPRPERREKTQFNAQLLEQRREDIFLAMHRLGNIR